MSHAYELSNSGSHSLVLKVLFCSFFVGCRRCSCILIGLLKIYAVEENNILLSFGLLQCLHGCNHYVLKQPVPCCVSLGRLKNSLLEEGRPITKGLATGFGDHFIYLQ